MSLTQQDLMYMDAGEEVVDAMGDRWVKAKDGLWEALTDADSEETPAPYTTSLGLLHAWGPVTPYAPRVAVDPTTPPGMYVVGQDGKLHDVGASVVSTDFNWSDQGLAETPAVPTTLDNYEATFQLQPVGKQRTAQAHRTFMRFVVGSPQQELLSRVNRRLKGLALGQPVNWKGL